MQTPAAFPGAIVEVLGWDEAFVCIDIDEPAVTGSPSAGHRA